MRILTVQRTLIAWEFPLLAALLGCSSVANAPSDLGSSHTSSEYAEYTPVIEPHVPVMLEQLGKIRFSPVNESSGLARSVRFPGVFWTHNDSGDWARIFAIRPDGSIVRPARQRAFSGIHVKGAGNADWEDIASGPDGTLYIGSFGNNANKRRDLGIYVVPEPDPTLDMETEPARFLPFIYPDQDGFPPTKMNFDCEALFFADGSLYLLTKHRSDSKTKLYRLPSLEDETTQTIELMGSLNISGMVTGADATPDGKRISILTYGSIWVFESDTPGNWFSGKGASLLFMNGLLCEGICFDGDSLLITNEQRSVFRVPLASLHPLRDMKVDYSRVAVPGP